MALDFLTYKHQENLIADVKIFKLKVNRDERGFLVETLKNTWTEVYGPDLPFTQSYYSVTKSGVSRDETLWHCHPTKQIDRFVIISGSVVFALYDQRKESKTFGRLNLFLMGEDNTDDNQSLLLVPKNVLHGFCVVSKTPACLLNFPTALFDQKEEGRVPFSEAKVKLPDGTLFSWQLVREAFK